MKNLIRNSFLIVSLFSAVPFAQAAESAWIPETLTNLTPEQTSDAAKSFSLTVTSGGGLMTHAGPVFTAGVEENVQLPYLISSTEKIRYPRWALRQGWEGELALALEILKDGSVGRTAVMQSTGHRLLDESALRAIRAWKFHPAVENGKPVVTCIQIPITFELEKE